MSEKILDLLIAEGETTGEVFEPEPGPLADRHVSDGAERCVNCGVNVYDDAIYGPFECVPHEPMSYSTQTGDPSVFGNMPQGEEI